ncbi:MAG: TniQ family protein [Verrucomicrobiia bacterium]
MSAFLGIEDVTELEERPVIPSRSRLYCLEPAGLGTGMVESLTSYLARLSAAHSLTLSTFVSKILAPMSTVKGLIGFGGRYDVLRRLGASLNGTGNTSADCARVIEMLTRRVSLSGQTMRFGAKWLSQRALLCTHQKWCPRCLMEWQNRGTTIYYPLLWQLEAVQLCADHHTLLESRCPHCNKPHRPLGKHLILGHCPHCFGWLGVNDRTVRDEGDENAVHQARQFVANQSRKLIASATVFDSHQHSVWSPNIKYLVRQSAGGVAHRLSQCVGISHDTVSCWIQKEHVPTLPSALMVAYAFDLNLVNLLTAPLRGEVRLVRSTRAFGISSLFRAKLRRHDAKMIMEILTRAAERPANPPLSLMRVCKMAGCDQSYVSRKFPDLAQRIIACHRSYVQIHKQQRHFFTGLVTKSVASQLAASGQYPSCRKMDQSLPSNISLRDPVARKAWLEVLDEWGWKEGRSESANRSS